VITVSHSNIATANSIRYCGGIPVFVDIDREMFNIDPRLIEQAVTSRTKAVLCVHQIGMPCDVAGILEITRRHSIPLIEDAACAIGSEIFWSNEWQKIGRPHGDAACFSFHPRKVLSTGDGGMITTRHKEWDLKFRLWRQHGMSISDTVRHASNHVTFESYTELGYNYRLTDVQAAIGREQLKRLPALVGRRRELAATYAALLQDTDQLRPPVEPEWARTNWQSYCIRLPESVGQRDVMQFLLDDGIATRRGIMCAHREPAYQREPWRSSGSLVESERAQDECILLPLFDGLTAEDQRSIVSRLGDALAARASA
jgi:dTDP-4-amino-4,6-dideoxygalactose transaminase